MRHDQGHNRQESMLRWSAEGMWLKERWESPVDTRGSAVIWWCRGTSHNAVTIRIYCLPWVVGGYSDIHETACCYTTWRLMVFRLPNLIKRQFYPVHTLIHTLSILMFSSTRKKCHPYFILKHVNPEHLNFLQPKKKEYLFPHSYMHGNLRFITLVVSYNKHELLS
jgi:hypothetical protein